MGDRTYVTLTVPLVHKQEVLQICKDYSCPSEQEECGAMFIAYFEEVNHGELPFLDTLQDRGIAYDSEWEEGGSYGAGGAYLRFTKDGKADFKEIYDNCRNPPLNNLLKVIDAPEELRKVILAFCDSIIVLPWDNQVEYGKTYRVLRLLNVPEFA
jgi:hypothetical protein